jgi:hypothetical protein
MCVEFSLLLLMCLYNVFVCFKQYICCVVQIEIWLDVHHVRIRQRLYQCWRKCWNRIYHEWLQVVIMFHSFADSFDNNNSSDLIIISWKNAYWYVWTILDKRKYYSYFLHVLTQACFPLHSKNTSSSQMQMTHACNPSYLWGRD